MATNLSSGDGHRNGAVRKRSQVFNPKTEQWVKRDKDTGCFMDVKQDGTPLRVDEKKSNFYEDKGNTCPRLFYIGFIINSMKEISSSDRWNLA